MALLKCVYVIMSSGLTRNIDRSSYVKYCTAQNHIERAVNDGPNF